MTRIPPARRDFPPHSRDPSQGGQAARLSPIVREGGRITGGAFTAPLWTLLVRGATVPYVPLLIEAAAAGQDDVIRRFVSRFGGSGGFGAYSYGQAMAVTCHESLAAEVNARCARAGEFDPATPPDNVYQAARFLPNSTVVNVTGASHAPLHADSCTREVAQSFLESPGTQPDLRCLDARPAFRFATDGLAEFLASREK